MSIYISKGKGLWENIEVYTPNWSEKNLIYILFYLFVLVMGLQWFLITTRGNNRFLQNKQIMLISIILILFSFMIFCMSDGNTSIEEMFVLASIILGILVYNFLIVLLVYNYSLKLFSFIPLAIFTYIYIWAYKIKNNY